MALTKKEVEHIALLSRLSLSEEEKEKFAKQLSSILDYVDQLQEVDTAKVKSTTQVTGLENVLRQDKIEDCEKDTRDRILKNAPEVEDKWIKTKSVFE